jgi:hypothetical protein
VTLRDGQVRERNHGGANRPRRAVSSETTRKRTRAGIRKFGVCRYPAMTKARSARY